MLQVAGVGISPKHTRSPGAEELLAPSLVDEPSFKDRENSRPISAPVNSHQPHPEVTEKLSRPNTMPTKLGQHHSALLRRQQQENLKNFLNSSQASVMVGTLLSETTGHGPTAQVLRLDTAGTNRSTKGSPLKADGQKASGGRVLWHQSDNAFRPVVGNRAVERRKKRSFNSRSLPVQARTPAEVTWIRGI